MNWQPINTAPTDGTLIFAFWRNVQGLEPIASSYGVTCCINGIWRNPDDHTDEYAAPTHWMPLVPPSL